MLQAGQQTGSLENILNLKLMKIIFNANSDELGRLVKKHKPSFPIDS